MTYTSAPIEGKYIDALTSDLLRPGILIGGGAARAWLMGLMSTAPAPSDIDLFVYGDAFAADDNQERYIVEPLRSVLRARGYSVISADDAVESWSSADRSLPIQIIKRSRSDDEPRWLTPSDVLDGFEFRCERFGIFRANNEIASIVDEHAVRDVNDHRLVIATIRNPIRHVHRIAKYAAKGFKISDVEIAKLFVAYDTRDAEAKSRLLDEAVEDYS